MLVNAEIEICPAFGWMGGPEFETIITTQRNGIEYRIGKNARVRHRFTLPFQNIKSEQYRLRLKHVFMVARGRLNSFLAKDETDYLADGEVFGIGNGTQTAFQLSVASTFGGENYVRTITKPGAGAIVFVNGTPTAATVSATTGLVTFAAPPANEAVLSWSGEFRVPVRFASDVMPMSVENRFGEGSYAMSGSIELVEVFE